MQYWQVTAKRMVCHVESVSKRLVFLSFPRCSLPATFIVQGSAGAESSPSLGKCYIILMRVLFERKVSTLVAPGKPPHGLMTAGVLPARCRGNGSVHVQGRLFCDLFHV